MAISFSSAPGNIFNRLGKIALLVKQVGAYQSSQKTNLIDTTNGVVAQFNAESDIQAIVGSSYIGVLNSAGPSAGSIAASLAQQTVNRVVYRDNPRINQNLQSLQVTASLLEVFRQMGVAGATVLAATIGGTATGFTSGSNESAGNGVVNFSAKRPFDGRVLENAYAENLLLTCSSDSYSGGQQAGNETFLVTGAGNEPNFFAFDWPLGSNCSINTSAINGNANNSQGNILTNSGFETWVSGVLSNFTLVTGVWGTNLVQETSVNYDGSNALRLVGDAALTLSQIKQQLTVNPSTQHSFNVFMRRDAVAAGAGQLTIDLVDQNNTVINDNNGVANTFNIDLTALTTVYTSKLGVFRLPIILPTSVFLRIRLTTALTNGRAVYLDKMSMGPMTQTYLAGPYVSIHSGAIPFVQNDYATLAMTNSRGSGGTLDTFQTFFARVFPDMYGSGFLVPSSATPSISDASLIS